MLGNHSVSSPYDLRLRKLLAFVGFPLVYPQTIVRTESVFTNVTIENIFSLLWQFSLRINTFFRWRALLLFQEGLLASGISPDGRWAWLLLGLAWSDRGQSLVPCIKGEGGGGANFEGEVEGQALANQRLAEFQALGRQRGVTFTHCSHFVMHF